MKTVVITGANVGIGYAAAKFIAANHDWLVVLACRNQAKAEHAITQIRRENPHANLAFAPLDLFSLASVRQLPHELAALHVPPIAGLILNAGGINMNTKTLEFTEDGFERTFQLNFLGHFALVNLILPRMPERARIIFVSSDLHDPTATRMGKIMAPRYGPVEYLARGIGSAAKLHPMARYATAKLYSMMAAYELDRKLRQIPKRLTVNSWSPGVVPTTQAGRNMNPIMKMILTSRWFVNFMGSHLSTEKEAGRALAALLLDPSYEKISGKYFDGWKEIPSSSESRDELKSRAVWEQAIKLAGLTGEVEKGFRGPVSELADGIGRSV
jgi:NAD(P)-dependent dehydrogenase (short-subunit alcohol dehydrogenase family)